MVVGTTERLEGSPRTPCLMRNESLTLPAEAWPFGSVNPGFIPRGWLARPPTTASPFRLLGPQGQSDGRVSARFHSDPLNLWFARARGCMIRGRVFCLNARNPPAADGEVNCLPVRVRRARAGRRGGLHHRAGGGVPPAGPPGSGHRAERPLPDRRARDGIDAAARRDDAMDGPHRARARRRGTLLRRGGEPAMGPLLSTRAESRGESRKG